MQAMRRLMGATAGMGSFAPISFWMDTNATNDRVAPTLAGSYEVDVAIVGAGYTGLSTALALRADGLSVALVERDVAGAGASGRNCGQVGADIGKSLQALRMQLGRERAREATAVLRAAISHLEEAIHTHGIDCSYQQTGNIFAGVHPRQTRFIERTARIAEELRLPVTVLSRNELRARGIPEAVVCGYQEHLGGALHPGRYARGLRRAALAAGALLFERSPVLSIEDGDPLILRTPHGRLRCGRCVLATNAYTPNLGWMRRMILPVAVSALVTEPLNDTQRARLGWEGREPIYTAHHVLENLRWTDDGRILVGTKRVRTGFGRAFAPADDPKTFRALERVLRTRFPELHDVPVVRRWTGPVALTPDFLPVFGRTGRARNVFYGGGYGGHGISMASYAGRIIADLIAGRDLGPARVLVDRHLPPLPPEPLRWLVGNTIISTLQRLDDRLDHAAQRERVR